MKENSQQILTWLYTPADQVRTSAHQTSQSKFIASYEQLELLLPDLTAGGRRSLVYYLKQQHLLRTERLGTNSGLSITAHGRDVLEKLFPALSARFRGDLSSSQESWRGQWSVLIFIEGPKGDPHFRYLRELLLEHHALALSRGVYLYPGQMPTKVTDNLKELYVGSVQLFEIKEWLFGDEQTIVDEHYGLSDVAEILSGLSSEVNELLRVKKEQKGLTDRDKQHIFSVFNRLFENLKQDPGLTSYYHPNLITSAELLNSLQQLI